MRHYNERAINGMYHGSKPARVILNTLAGMPRQNETRLDTLENRLGDHKEITRRDVVNFFKTLEEYGAGEFIPGRRGHPSRFKWTVDSINVATVDVSLNQDEPEPLPAPSHHRQSEVLIKHRYQLRPDLSIDIALPGDLSTIEANRLSQFIQSLPFVTLDRPGINRVS